jgi:hypothetical protein
VRSTQNSLMLVVLAAACGGGGRQKPADAPLRPPTTALTPAAPPPTAPAAIGDCAVVEPSQGPPPKSYKDLSVTEAEAYAKQGLEIQVRSEKIGLPEQEWRGMLKQASDKYFTALAADPYNVKATYNLAAAYGRIGRCTCAENLLARLNAMKAWGSVKVAVDDAGDRLNGRAGKWKDRPDPDLDRCRTDERFRAINKF